MHKIRNGSGYADPNTPRYDDGLAYRPRRPRVSGNPPSDRFYRTEPSHGRASSQDAAFLPQSHVGHSSAPRPQSQPVDWLANVLRADDDRYLSSVLDAIPQNERSPLVDRAMDYNAWKCALALAQGAYDSSDQDAYRWVDKATHAGEWHCVEYLTICKRLHHAPDDLRRDWLVRALDAGAWKCASALQKKAPVKAEAMPQQRVLGWLDRAFKAEAWDCGLVLLKVTQNVLADGNGGKRLRQVLKGTRLQRPAKRELVARLSAALIAAGPLQRSILNVPLDAAPSQRQALASIDALSQFLPISLRESRSKTLRSFSRRLRSSFPMTINVPIEVAKPLAESGVFKTAFETGTSRGEFMPGGLRESAHDALFFKLYQQAPAPEQPRYGFIDTGIPGGLRHYGEMQLVLSNRLRPYATITAGDSLNDDACQVARLQGDHLPLFTSMPKEDLREIVDVSRDRRKPNLGNPPHFEMQLHHAIDLSRGHVREIVIRRDDARHPQLQDVFDLGRKFSIPVARMGYLPRR